MLIKAALTIDLTEDIKNVIDLEDFSETEVLSEIENYIITDGLAKEYADFVSTFTSNILETGVWISGFYGSGKSYFGKLLGYMLNNRSIAGTPARERILQRFTGVADEPLVRNAIAKLDSRKCRVVFLDIAKQDTSKGFAYALFRNFLRSLNLTENEHGFLLYQMMMDAKNPDVTDFIFQNLSKDWDELRRNVIAYAGAIKTIFLASGKNESDYTSILETLRRDIDQFSSSRLREEVNNYIKLRKDESIVFLFDEASEAISQGKFTLLDLEGLSESLSSLGGRVWTIAIAQEKLDDVINNSNVNVAQLTKVTDRFKTKIHLEATEVDIIIRSRLLKKTDSAVEALKEHYAKNSGRIADHSSLTGIGLNRTENEDSYVTYYPFYKNQFDLLQNFLFGTKGYASTKVAARGMIITTYEILKNELQPEPLFNVATGWQISRQALQQPRLTLVSRFDSAEKVLREEGSSIPGRKLLETINFLAESETVQTSTSNIVKTYIGDSDLFTTTQPEVEKALNTLVEAKILLVANGTYRITSDIEQRMLDEMKEFAVQTFVKKKALINALKSSAPVKTLSKIAENNLSYDFYITTDNDDELTAPALKQLKLRIKSLYNISDNRTTDIDGLKTQHQNDKDIIWIVPDNSHFTEIDRLIDEIERITYLEQKYQNPRTEEASIIQAFLTARSEKINRLTSLVEQSLQNGDSVYLYNELRLDKDNWQTTVQSLQRQVIKNLYSKRLESQLSDDVATKVIKEANGGRLASFFHGPDFAFFDAEGKFVGETLKPAEEILYQIRNTFVDGKTLQNELEKPPNGYSFGTVISTAAALMRGGKIIAKHNGETKFSWKDAGVSTIFSNATQFRKASFKAVSKSLSTQQKSEIVTALHGLDFETHMGIKVDWNTNDFDIANAIRDLARKFTDKVEAMRATHPEFSSLFADLDAKSTFLGEFSGAVSEANYFEKAEDFLSKKEEYSDAVVAIEKAEKFVGKNLPNLRLWKRFADGVTDELVKAATSNEAISTHYNEFKTLYQVDVVKNFHLIQQKAQKIKDEYFSLIKSAAAEMAAKYGGLKIEAEELVAEISLLPPGLNTESERLANSISQYAEQRTRTNVSLDWDVKDSDSKFTYSEILSFIDLFPMKQNEILIARSSLVREAAPAATGKSKGSAPTVQTIKTSLPATKMTVSEYRLWLQSEMQRIATAQATDEIEFDK
jgi:hypothetical protein